MTRPFCLLALACCAATLLGASCGKKPPPGQHQNALCRTLHERNRKCIKTLIKALHSRMGDKVPAKLKQKLAHSLSVEITKGEFLNKCREQAEANNDHARALKKSLQKCHAKADCDTYAACFLRVMDPANSPK